MTRPYLTHTQSTASSTWTLDTEPYLPFRGRARFVDSVVASGTLRNSGNTAVYLAPSVDTGQGSNLREINLGWGTAVKGEVRYIVRMDNPL